MYYRTLNELDRTIDQERVLERGCSRGGAQEGVLRRGSSSGGAHQLVLKRGCSSGGAQEGMLRSKQAARQAPGRNSVGAMPWRGLLTLTMMRRHQKTLRILK